MVDARFEEAPKADGDATSMSCRGGEQRSGAGSAGAWGRQAAGSTDAHAGARTTSDVLLEAIKVSSMSPSCSPLKHPQQRLPILAVPAGPPRPDKPCQAQQTATSVNLLQAHARRHWNRRPPLQPAERLTSARPPSPRPVDG